MYFIYYKSIDGKPVKNALINEFYNKMGFPDKLNHYNISALDFDLSTLNPQNSFDYHSFQKDQQKVKKFLKESESGELMLVVHSDYQTLAKDGVMKPNFYKLEPENDTNVYIDSDYVLFPTDIYIKNREKVEKTAIDFGVMKKIKEQTITDDIKQIFLSDFALSDKGWSNAFFSEGDFEGMIMRFYTKNTKELEKLYFFSNKNNLFVNNTNKYFSAYTIPIDVPTKERSNTGGKIIVIDKDKMDEIYIAKMKLPCSDFSIDNSNVIDMIENDEFQVVERSKTTSLVPKPKTNDGHGYSHSSYSHTSKKDYSENDYHNSSSYYKEPIDKTEYKEIIFKPKNKKDDVQS